MILMADETKVVELKKLIRLLKKIRGRHTELVTVYVPSGYNLLEIINQLKSEGSTTQNIKSKATRNNVLAALDKIIQHLRLYRETPENGLALFAGNVSETEGSQKMELWAIEPPEKMQNKLYWCDQSFVLEPLEEMVKDKEIYGLLAVDKSEATIGYLIGKKIVVFKHIESLVPGKTAAGGWSQARYDRIRQGLLNDFLKEVSDVATQAFVGKKELLGLIVGGPGPVKDTFVKDGYLHYELQKKIAGVVDISYTNEPGLHELVNRAQKILVNAAVTKEIELLNGFFTELQKDSGLAVYGWKKVKDALQNGMLQKLIVSEDFDWIRSELKCGSCGNEETRDYKPNEKQLCSRCRMEMRTSATEDLIDVAITTAEDFKTEYHIVSSSTREGTQLKELGGIGGILRYRTKY
ncbi:MAG: peptide chain release factor aRF-1 [Candidatus Aenigmarchaeota archaeon]|nr:peptide chain release factor aRF-1 [Candidatus Aenigmarchaeota archaeon]